MTTLIHREMVGFVDSWSCKTAERSSYTVIEFFTPGYTCIVSRVTASGTLLSSETESVRSAMHSNILNEACAVTASFLVGISRLEADYLDNPLQELPFTESDGSLKGNHEEKGVLWQHIPSCALLQRIIKHLPGIPKLHRMTPSLLIQLFLPMSLNSKGGGPDSRSDVRHAQNMSMLHMPCTNKQASSKTPSDASPNPYRPDTTKGTPGVNTVWREEGGNLETRFSHGDDLLRIPTLAPFGSAVVRVLTKPIQFLERKLLCPSCIRTRLNSQLCRSPVSTYREWSGDTGFIVSAEDSDGS